MSTLQAFLLNIILVNKIGHELQFTNSLSKLNISSRNSHFSSESFIHLERTHLIKRMGKLILESEFIKQRIKFPYFLFIKN